MKLASFDIFDTTLIRKCGSPQNIFFLLSKKLYPDNEGWQSDFFMWRINAEKNIAKVLNKSVVTLDDIYSGHNMKDLGILEVDNAKEKEKIIESCQLTYNLNVKDEINKRRSEGYTICFISDMYLDSTFLKSVLMREGCAKEEDLVFVSCEYEATKRGGQLFQVVRKHYSAIEEWIHYGDNRYSDFIASKKNGVNGILVNSDYTKNEKVILDKYRIFPFSYTLSVLIGFQRCSRLHLSNNNPDFENASDYIASVYIPYLEYVFLQSKKTGIERLYFLSRDAYILYDAALHINNYHSCIESKYLFVSRKSLLPIMGKETREKNLVIKYLLQEGVLDNKKIGIVDVGWYGSTREMLNKLRQERGLEEITTFYLSCQKNVLGASKGTYYTYFPWIFKTVDRQVLIETYLSACPFETTVGYHEDHEIVKPLFGDEKSSNDSIITANTSVINFICKCIDDLRDCCDFSPAYYVWGASFLEAFTMFPNNINYKTFEGLKSYEGGTDILTKISFGEIYKYVRYGESDTLCLLQNSLYYKYGKCLYQIVMGLRKFVIKIRKIYMIVRQNGRF